MVKWLLWHRAARCVPGVGTAGESGRLYLAVHREEITKRKWLKADIWIDTCVDNRMLGWGD